MQTLKRHVQDKRAATFWALVAMFFWGSLYPCIKLGYAAFSIDTSRPANVLLFAGIRFLICGAALLLPGCARDRRLTLPDRPTFVPVLLIALSGYVAHYSCTYVGMSMIESAKTALLKQIGSLFIICFAFLFRKEDRFTLRKLVSGLMGFAGILAINLEGARFHMGPGEALIIAASFCSALNMIVSKSAYDRLDPLTVTGWAQLLGGVMLTALGAALGGVPGRLTPTSCGLMAYICFASCMGYALWNLLLRHSDLSRLNQIKFAEPLFGALCSAVLLGENIFRWSYLLAFLFVGIGIFVGRSRAG